MSYDEFKVFWDKHPDQRNDFYYTQFNETPQGTVRTWKFNYKKLKNGGKKTKQNKKRKKGKPAGQANNPPQNSTPAIPTYQDINIKPLIKNWSIHQLMTNSRFSGQALQVLSKPEFIEQGEIKHGVFWTSDMPPYRRPPWVYPWQSVGIDLLKYGHAMWQAGRQKIGKTTGAFMADFEDMLEKPGTTCTLVAPGKDQAAILLRQGFKEIITLEDGSKFDLWNQLYKPYFIVDNALKMVMKNGSLIQVVALDYKTSPGLATDILHIEEIDKAVQDPQKLRGLGAIFPTIRARRGYAKIRITCNNTSGIYRILRDDLKQFGQYFPIYMEVPWRPDLGQKFTGEHFIFNEHVNLDAQPDMDDVLKVIESCLLGKGYALEQLGNLDNYENDMFNPDKLEIAYDKGKAVVPRERYPHSAMGIDPGAVHAFAVTVYGKDGQDVDHLWTRRFTISGRTEGEKTKMLKVIGKTVAEAYIRFHCEFVASESNSGAKLIIPFIQYYYDKMMQDLNLKTQNFSTWRIIWSNWTGDKEQGLPSRGIQKANYLMLLAILLDYQLLTLQDRNEHEHMQKIEFSRYDLSLPASADNKFKGDCVDSSAHVVWHLYGGRKGLNELLGIQKTPMRIAL